MKKERTDIVQYHLHRAYPEKLQFEVYNLSDYLDRYRKKASIPHSHSYYQIIWFLNSGGKHIVDFKSYDVKTNTLLFVSKDQVHAFDKKQKHEGWLIHFNESFFMHTDVDIFLKYKIFASHQNPNYCIDQKTAESAHSYVSLIRKELKNRHQFGFEEVIRFLLKSFLISLERIHQKDSSKKLGLNKAYELQYYNFRDLVELHFKEGFSIEKYADVLNISSRTLTTITKSIVGKSPSVLISERVILEAKRLLKFSPLQISEVAFRLGFEDDSYFIKYFKRHMGVSPVAYRNQISN